MKVKQDTTLFKVISGSRLYGTDTPKSDFDYKAVSLPALETLLANTKVMNRKEKPEGVGAGDKMIAGETETEYLPVQVFLDDFFAGQTYALEVAFAVAQHKHASMGGTSPTAYPEKWTWLMQELISKFLTNNVKKMVGYAVSQSRLYGLKTERFTSLKQVVEILEDYTIYRPDSTLASSNPTMVQTLTRLPHVKIDQIPNGSGGATLVPALNVCGKQFPFTNKVDTIVTSLRTILGGYGARVASFDGEGVDWKALSHAIRITEQVLELSKTGKLEFPRPNAQFLLHVKNGYVPLDEATAYLDSAFNEVDEAISNSVLQERTPELENEFLEWKTNVLFDLYADQMEDALRDLGAL